jgi:Uma2 family endonuclease
MSIASVGNGVAMLDLDEPTYEIIAGEYKELPPTNARDCFLGSLLMTNLSRYVDQHRLGRAVNKVLFDLRPSVDRARRPDVAFVSYDRWPKSRLIPRINAWPVVPDLAVEIVSPTNTFEEVLEKMREYFQAGTRLVWFVFSVAQEVYAYTTPTTTRIFTRADDLTADPVLAGFKLPLANLFEEGTED